MKSSWERLSTRHLWMALETHVISARTFDSEVLHQEIKEMTDVLQERHPEIQSALMRWAQSGQGPHGDINAVDVALKATREVIDKQRL